MPSRSLERVGIDWLDSYLESYEFFHRAITFTFVKRKKKKKSIRRKIEEREMHKIYSVRCLSLDLFAATRCANGYEWYAV